MNDIWMLVAVALWLIGATTNYSDFLEAERKMKKPEPDRATWVILALCWPLLALLWWIDIFSPRRERSP